MDKAVEFTETYLRHFIEFSMERPERCLVKAPAENIRGIILGHSNIPKWNIDAGCVRLLRTDTYSPEVITVPMEWIQNLKIDGKAYTEETFQEETFQVRGSKGNYYTVTQSVDGSRTCSCPGFKYRRSCRHV